MTRTAFPQIRLRNEGVWQMLLEDEALTLQHMDPAPAVGEWQPVVMVVLTRELFAEDAPLPRRVPMFGIRTTFSKNSADQWQPNPERLVFRPLQNGLHRPIGILVTPHPNTII